MLFSICELNMFMLSKDLKVHFNHLIALNNNIQPTGFGSEENQTLS